MFKKLGNILEKYLNHSKDWEHSHIKSIGEIQRTHPWREDTWRHKDSGWHIICWRNFKPNPILSGPTTSHSWRIGNSKHKEQWCLSFKYGICSRFNGKNDSNS